MSLSNHKSQVIHYLSVDTFRWSMHMEIYPTPTYPHPLLLPIPPTPTPTYPTHPYPYLQPTHPYLTTPTYPTHAYPYLHPPTPTLPTPPTPTYPHPPLPLIPYYHSTLLPLTTTHPYYPPTTTHPTQNNGLERSQFIDNVKHGLEKDWFCQWLVMWSRSRRWIQTLPPATPTPWSWKMPIHRQC